jgi:adenylosuccinate lyase
MIHPTDSRYLVKELAQFLSEEALLRYKLRVEAAHAQALCKIGVCSSKVSEEISGAAKLEIVGLKEVGEMEKLLKHDVRAMVEVLRSKVSSEARRYVHLGLTSYDVVNNAQVLALKDAMYNVVLPDMTSLLETLLALAMKERDTVQIGRTHGQHAVPTTFGREIAVFVQRWGEGIERVLEATTRLRGKIGGAVGTKASLGLLGDPEEVERLILQELGIDAAKISTQIIPFEQFAKLFAEVLIAFGTLADFANDMRNLQRSEIGEVWEASDERQIGSSTMPQKRNPVDWENIISQYRAVMPHIVTCLMNIESEHQRDLRDSAATRYLVPEILNAFDHSIRRAERVVKRMTVDKEAMRRNLEADSGFCLAEAAYIAMAMAGEEDAYGYIRSLSIKARAESKRFDDALKKDAKFCSLIENMSPEIREVFTRPERYIGSTLKQVDSVAEEWKKRLPILWEEIRKRAA